MESAQLLSQIEALPDALRAKVEDYIALLSQRLKKENKNTSVDWAAKYKGAMSGQSEQDIERQLKELREGWE